MHLFFTRLDEKHKLLGNYEKILKVFDEDSLYFYIYFGMFVSTNRAFRNTIIFLQQFVRFRGWG